MGSIYVLALRQLAGRWRILVMTALAGMPVLMVSIMLLSDSAPSLGDFETVVLSAMLMGAIAPLVVLAIAAPAFANEVEDRTLANLTLAPLPRWQIVVPKLFAAITLAGAFVAMSALATTYVAYLGDTRAMLAVTASLLVGVALYAAAFLWLGLISTQAIGVGLLYIVLWEGFFSGFVSGVRLLSIRHYAVALTHALDPRRFAAVPHPSAAAAVAICAVVFAAFVLLAVRRLRRMDVP